MKYSADARTIAIDTKLDKLHGPNQQVYKAPNSWCQVTAAAWYNFCRTHTPSAIDPTSLKYIIVPLLQGLPIASDLRVNNTGSLWEAGDKTSEGDFFALLGSLERDDVPQLLASYSRLFATKDRSDDDRFATVKSIGTIRLQQINSTQGVTQQINGLYVIVLTLEDLSLEGHYAPDLSVSEHP